MRSTVPWAQCRVELSWDSWPGGCARRPQVVDVVRHKAVLGHTAVALQGAVHGLVVAELDEEVLVLAAG
eukprot:8908562-Alexandrium_andersonii.AAC.1